jgi:predicted Rossmann fold flavoprotein
MSSASSALSVTVVGAGAAGLVAAIFAASNKREVLVVESTADGGRKILISGGGRCNILTSILRPERFVTGSSVPLMRRMLKAWPLHEQRAFFENEVGIPLKLEEETGKLFPASDRALDVRDGLIELARKRGVKFAFKTRLTSLADVKADRVILATGGLSVPTTGSDGAGLALVKQLGHRIVPTYPALTPLVAENSPHASLSGVSLNVRLRGKAGKRAIETEGGFLFTHRGYSGPSVLDISHVITVGSRETGVGSRPGVGRPSIRVQWTGLTAHDWTREFDAPSAAIATLLGRRLPSRLAEYLMNEAGVPADRRTSDLRRAERTKLIELLTSYVLPWTGDEGYKKAEVTGGGVALDEVDTRTLESRRVKGLFLCGEMLDAFGPIGGHNFAWAWATGRAAGRGAGEG